MRKNTDFVNLLNNLCVKCKKTGFQISNTSLLPDNIHSTYVDRLIRYKICAELKEEFFDEKCDHYCHMLQLDEDFFDDDMPSLEMMRKNYDNMRTFIATENDILNVALCNSFRFKEFDNKKYYDKFINKKEDNYDALEHFIKNKINGKANVSLNRDLQISDLRVRSYFTGPIAIDKELMDIKCSKFHAGNDIKDFTRLIIYVCLYFYQTGIKCNKITILNPILSYEKFVDLSNWDNFGKVISLLKQRVGFISHNSNMSPLAIMNFTQFLNNRFSLIYNAGIDT